MPVIATHRSWPSLTVLSSVTSSSRHSVCGLGWEDMEVCSQALSLLAVFELL